MTSGEVKNLCALIVHVTKSNDQCVEQDQLLWDLINDLHYLKDLSSWMKNGEIPKYLASRARYNDTDWNPFHGGQTVLETQQRVRVICERIGTWTKKWDMHLNDAQNILLTKLLA